MGLLGTAFSFFQSLGSLANIAARSIRTVIGSGDFSKIGQPILPSGFDRSLGALLARQNS